LNYINPAKAKKQTPQKWKKIEKEKHEKN